MPQTPPSSAVSQSSAYFSSTGALPQTGNASASNFAFSSAVPLRATSAPIEDTFYRLVAISEKMLHERELQTQSAKRNHASITEATPVASIKRARRDNLEEARNKGKERLDNSLRRAAPVITRNIIELNDAPVRVRGTSLATRASTIRHALPMNGSPAKAHTGAVSAAPPLIRPSASSPELSWARNDSGFFFDHSLQGPYPQWTLGVELVRCARSIDAQPRFEDRFARAASLAFLVDTVALLPEHHAQLVEALQASQVVHVTDAHGFEILVDQWAHIARMCADPQREVERTRRCSIVFGLMIRRLHALPPAYRSRLAQKIIAQLPCLQPAQRLRKQEELLYELRVISQPAERYQVLKALLLANRPVLTYAEALELLYGMIAQVAEAKSSEFGQELGALFQLVDRLELPGRFKLALLERAVIVIDSAFEAYASQSEQGWSMHRKEFEDMLGLAPMLADTTAKRIVAWFLAAHVAHCDFTHEEQLSVFKSLIQMTRDPALPLRHQLSSLAALVTSVAARSSMPDARLDELPLLIDACALLELPVAAATLVMIAAKLPPANPRRGAALRRLIEKQLMRLPPVRAARVMDVLAKQQKNSL